MKNRIRILTTLIGLIIGGIAYWFQPYNQSTVLGINIWMIISMGAFIASFLRMLFVNEKPTEIALLLALGVELAVLARIVYDITFWDKTSHNLAPFEIILCGIITIPSAFIGVYLALLLKRNKKIFDKS